MLELEGVSKRVGAVDHLSDVTMRLEPGTLNVLLGPTLSGKTSLMRIMAGLDKPTSGSVRVDGEDVTGISVRNRDVAMVYQQFINYPAMSVYDNIASPMRLAKKSRSEVDRIVRETAQLLKLEPYLDRLPLQLSGGQQQRTALARALAKNATLVLLDEPLANLDYKLREDLRAELPKIFGASGAIFVYATAEPEEALLLGGHTATLQEGRMTQFGPTMDVYRQPASLSAARTFSDPPLNWAWVDKVGEGFVPSEANAGAFKTIPVPSTHTSLADGRYAIGIRPHHLRLEPRGPQDVTVSGPLITTEITGSETFVHVAFLERFIALTHGVRNLTPGEKIDLYFDREDLLIFDDAMNAVGDHAVRAAA